MYSIINASIDKILDSIDSNQVVQPYVWLVQHFDVVNVSTHVEFQQKYRRYWALNAARLNDNFCQRYFALLENSKHTQAVTVGVVARQLLEIPTHGDGRQSLQFSFASKFVHMLDRTLPIYDSMVENFYFLPVGSNQEDSESKLRRLTESYDFLKAEYARILRLGILARAIDCFRQKFHVNDEYTDQKIIDTLIWQFIGFMRKGAVIDGKVVYT